MRLGDRVLGEAPLTKLRVNAGKVHFEFAKEGFLTKTLDVALEGGKETPVEIKLAPRDSRATQKITSRVAGGAVATTLALTLERPADEGSLDPGQIPVVGAEASPWVGSAGPSFSHPTFVLRSPVISF